jgi:hypothetical protein
VPLNAGSLTRHPCRSGNFGQLAIDRWTPDALSIVDVDGNHRFRQGWSLSTIGRVISSDPKDFLLSPERPAVLAIGTV